MGGPIKEGIMDGIEEPRQGFQSGSSPIRDMAMKMNSGRGPITRMDYISLYEMAGYDDDVATSLGTKHYKTGEAQDSTTAGLKDGGRVGFQDGTPPSFFGLRFDKPFLTGESFRNLFKSPATVEKENEKLASIFAPDYSMSDYGKVPRLINPTDQLTASTTNVKIPEKKMEMIDPNVITTDDITVTEQSDEAFNIPKRSTFEQKMSEGMLKKGTPDNKTMRMKIEEGVLKKGPQKPEADSELLQKLGYDRAVKRGNYTLIEAIRRGLTEGGVQGALDAAFAAGAQDPYGEAGKIKQAAALKEYEMDLEEKKYQRRRGEKIEDQIKILEEKEKISPTKYAESVRTKDFKFAKNTLNMTDEEAIDYANKTTTVAQNIFTVTKNAPGGLASPNQLADAIRASGDKVDAVFDKSDDATKEAYVAKDGEYVVFDQEVFIGYKDPNSDEVFLNRIR